MTIDENAVSTEPVAAKDSPDGWLLVALICVVCLTTGFELLRFRQLMVQRKQIKLLEERVIDLELRLARVPDEDNSPAPRLVIVPRSGAHPEDQ